MACEHQKKWLSKDYYCSYILVPCGVNLYVRKMENGLIIYFVPFCGFNIGERSANILIHQSHGPQCVLEMSLSTGAWVWDGVRQHHTISQNLWQSSALPQLKCWMPYKPRLTNICWGPWLGVFGTRMGLPNHHTVAVWSIPIWLVWR